MLRLILITVIFAMFGCASPIPGATVYTEPPGAPEGMATLVIYRDKDSIGTAVGHSYFVNDAYVGALGYQTYTYVYLKPGPITVKWSTDHRPNTETRAKPQNATVEAGKIYYYTDKLTKSWPLPLLVVIVTTFYFETRFVPPNEAKKELATYRFVQARFPSM